MSDYSNIHTSENESKIKHLYNKTFPDISLPNQEENLLRLYRFDTFRMILYFFPMTGRPDRQLPENWNNIPGAKGCTIETCLFRDNKEMTARLKVPYDVLSDEKLELQNKLNLPFFLINKKKYLKRITIIIEKNIIKKVFYPIYEIDKHLEEVIRWLQKN